MASSKKTILYLHVDKSTKSWLNKLCKKQDERVSQSLMVERIFAAARKSRRLFKAA